MDAAYDMARDRRAHERFREPEDDGLEVLPCPAGESPAVEAQWQALAATCGKLTAAETLGLLDLARCQADMEEARRQVATGGAFVLTKGGDLAENPWADRERKLRAQAMQLRKGLDCLGKRVVSRDFAAQIDAKAKRKAEAEAKRKAEAEAKKAAAAEKRRRKREARESA